MNALRIAVLFLMSSLQCYAAAECQDSAGNNIPYCAETQLLDQAIVLFQNHDYVNAQKRFQQVIQTYPQSKDVYTKAVFYNAECARLLAKPRASKRVLKFKPATSHGQILSPGQQPPSSTLEESKTELSAPAGTGQP